MSIVCRDEGSEWSLSDGYWYDRVDTDQEIKADEEGASVEIDSEEEEGIEEDSLEQWGEDWVDADQDEIHSPQSLSDTHGTSEEFSPTGSASSSVSAMEVVSAMDVLLNSPWQGPDLDISDAAVDAPGTKFAHIFNSGSQHYPTAERDDSTPSHLLGRRGEATICSHDLTKLKLIRDNDPGTVSFQWSSHVNNKSVKLIAGFLTCNSVLRSLSIVAGEPDKEHVKATGMSQTETGKKHALTVAVLS